MTEVIERRHLDELDDWGFTVVEKLVGEDHLDRFERQIAELVSTQLAQLGLQPRHSDPFIDLFSVGGAYKSRFYALLERLDVLNQMCARIADLFEKTGFFADVGMKVPLVWPDIRADIPQDVEHPLPVHQDYKSTQCSNAYRLWIPLRPSNEITGTMCAYRGTHKHGPVAHDLGDPLRPTINPELYREAEGVVFDLPAGDGVLIDPLLFHASVPNRSLHTKFTLMIQIQDFATMIDPRDEKYRPFGKAVSKRVAAEAAIAD